jgi:endogenous inhibitor of DNA gyrase (YacG/DUF329 family)
MAMLQLKCPETGKPVDLGDVPPEANIALSLWAREVPCPHCGGKHVWASGQLGLAMQALHAAPDASRVLIDGDHASTKP